MVSSVLGYSTGERNRMATTTYECEDRIRTTQPLWPARRCSFPALFDVYYPDPGGRALRACGVHANHYRRRDFDVRAIGTRPEPAQERMI